MKWIRLPGADAAVDADEFSFFSLELDERGRPLRWCALRRHAQTTIEFPVRGVGAGMTPGRLVEGLAGALQASGPVLGPYRKAPE